MILNFIGIVPQLPQRCQQEYENLLLALAAQRFKRKIQLIPFLEQDDGLTFKPTKTWFSRLKKIFATDKPTFHILSCQNLRRDNFLSAFK